MYANALLDLAQLDDDLLVVRVGVPVDMAEVIARAVGPVVAENCRRQPVEAQVLAAGRVTAQRSLGLQAHALQAAQKRLVEQRCRLSISFAVENTLEPHRA